jgi:hypothetical protein
VDIRRLDIQRLYFSPTDILAHRLRPVHRCLPRPDEVAQSPSL